MSTKVKYTKTIKNITFPISKAQNRFITELRDKGKEDYADNFEIKLLKRYINNLNKNVREIK